MRLCVGGIMMSSPVMQIVGNILIQARLSCIYVVKIKLHAFFPKK